MHTRAKNSFETLCKYRITVKVLTERRPGFFGMNQADFDTSLYHAMTPRNGTVALPSFIYKSLMSAVPIQRWCLTFDRAVNTSL